MEFSRATSVIGELYLPPSHGVKETVEPCVPSSRRENGMGPTIGKLYIPPSRHVTQPPGIVVESGQISAVYTGHLDGRKPFQEFLPVFPYIQGDYSQSTSLSEWLSREIEDFCLYFSPSEQEILVRHQAMLTVAAALRQYYPHADFLVSGSSATNLFFPQADIDLVVCSSTTTVLENCVAHHQCADFLEKSGIGKDFRPRTTRAQVQTITFTENASNLSVDIVFDKPGGARAVERIRSWMQQFPELRPLTMVIKKFLEARGYGKVYSGGLSSYAVVCMIVHVLKRRRRIYGWESLAVLLLNFFEFYGHFDNKTLALSMRENMEFLEIDGYSHLKAPFSSDCHYGLCIEDPDDLYNNITQGTFNYHLIKQALRTTHEAYITQGTKLAALEMKPYRSGLCLLSLFVRVSSFGRDFQDDSDKVPPGYLQLNN